MTLITNLSECSWIRCVCVSPREKHSRADDEVNTSQHEHRRASLLVPGLGSLDENRTTRWLSLKIKAHPVLLSKFERHRVSRAFFLTLQAFTDFCYIYKKGRGNFRAYWILTCGLSYTASSAPNIKCRIAGHRCKSILFTSVSCGDGLAFRVI